MRIPVPDELLPADRLGRVHFVGIGGAALSAIARIMAARGVPVTGSDDHDTPFLPSLRELGVTVHLGYDAAHLGDRPTPSWSRRPRARTTPRCSRPGGAGCGCCRGRPGWPRSWTAAGARRRRHPRQDHDHLAAHRRPARGRRRPDVRRRGRARGDRPQRRRRAAATCSSPRPTRATAPSSSTGPTPRSSPTSRPTTSTSGAPRRPTARRSSSSSTASTPPGSWCAASTTPVRPTWPAPPAAAGCDVVSGRRDRRRRAAGQRPGLRRHHLARSRSSTPAPTLGRVTLQIPGRHYVLDALAALARRAPARPRLRRPAPRAWSRSPAPGGGWSPRARPGECGSTTATPTTRARSRPTCRPRGPSRATAGCVVAFQPHLVSRTRIFGAEMGARARRGRRGRRARRLPRPRGLRPRGHRAGWSPRPCRCPPSGCVTCPTATPSRGCWSRWRAPATSC